MSLWSKALSGCVATLGISALFLGPAPAQAGAAGGLVARLKEPGQAQIQQLRTWNGEELSRLKRHSSREKDPATGQVVRWEGILLSELVDEALHSLSPKTRADIDLIRLRNASGEQALIPRAFVVKYPILLAFQRDDRSLGAQSPYSVIPWTSKSKITQEGVPLERFFLPGVAEVEFLNSVELFAAYRLKRRTDPAAMNGEKIFLRTCVNCHSTGTGPSLSSVSAPEPSRKLASGGHPEVPGGPRIEGKERRFLSAYLDAVRGEAR